MTKPKSKDTFFAKLKAEASRSPLQALSVVTSMLGLLVAVIAVPWITMQLESVRSAEEQKTKMSVECKESLAAPAAFVFDKMHVLAHCSITNDGSEKITVTEVNPTYYAELGKSPYIPANGSDILLQQKLDEETKAKLVQNSLPFSLDRSEVMNFYTFVSVPFSVYDMPQDKRTALETCGGDAPLTVIADKIADCIGKVLGKPIANYLYNGAGYGWDYVRGIGVRVTASDKTFEDHEYVLTDAGFSRKLDNANPRLDNVPDELQDCWHYAHQSDSSDSQSSYLCGTKAKATVVISLVVMLLSLLLLIGRLVWKFWKNNKKAE